MVLYVPAGISITPCGGNVSFSRMVALSFSWRDNHIGVDPACPPVVWSQNGRPFCSHRRHLPISPDHVIDHDGLHAGTFFRFACAFSVQIADGERESVGLWSAVYLSGFGHECPGFFLWNFSRSGSSLRRPESAPASLLSSPPRDFRRNYCWWCAVVVLPESNNGSPLTNRVFS